MIRYIWRHGGRERVLHFYITGDTHGNFDRIEERPYIKFLWKKREKRLEKNEILYQRSAFVS